METKKNFYARNVCFEFQSPHSLDYALIPCLIISDDSNGNEENFLCKKWNTQSDGAHIHGATNPSMLSKVLIHNNNQTYSFKMKNVLNYFIFSYPIYNQF